MLDFGNDGAISLSLDLSFLEQANPEVLQNDQNSKFEDFAENGAFYSLAMKIGGRRQMQDRVLYYFSLTLLIID